MSLAEKKTVKAQGGTVGFVFPVHALTIPVAVKKFLTKTDLSAADYVFAVATRLGTVFRGFEKMDSILKRKGKRLHAGFLLNMCNNDARHGIYKIPTPEEIQALEQGVLNKLAVIQDAVQKKRESREEDTEYTVGAGFLTEKMVLAGMALSERIGGVQYFLFGRKVQRLRRLRKSVPFRQDKDAGQKAGMAEKRVLRHVFCVLEFLPPGGRADKGHPRREIAFQGKRSIPAPVRNGTGYRGAKIRQKRLKRLNGAAHGRSFFLLNKKGAGLNAWLCLAALVAAFSRSPRFSPRPSEKSNVRIRLFKIRKIDTHGKLC